MEQASLSELMPGFDKDAEWLQLSARMQTKAQPRVRTMWKYAAAVLLLAGSGLVAYLATNSNNNEIAVASRQAPANWGEFVASGIIAAETNNEQTVAATDTGSRIAAITEVKAESPARKTRQGTGMLKPTNHEVFYNYYHANEYACNGTSCPLEICIVQSIKCHNSKPSAVATCSVLAPDQSGKVGYKVLAQTMQHCKTTVKEIRIKRIPTGETIVLNEHTKPATAQDLFNYITGEKRGDILAGIFETDCDNDCNTSHLKLDNNYGDLMLQ